MKEKIVHLDVQQQTSELAARIEAANAAYYNGESIISDNHYDALKENLRTLSKEHNLLTKVGHSTKDSPWTNKAHSIVMSSLDKVNTIIEFKNWAEARNIESIVIEEKLDGLSVSLNYEGGRLISAISRGNGEIGEEITRNVLRMKGNHICLNNPFTGSIRGEIILFRADWLNHLPNISNPRNGASGVARRLDGTDSQHLTVVCYDILPTEDMGFTHEGDKLKELTDLGLILPTYYIGSIHDLEPMYNDFQGNLNNLPYEIDGLVIKASSLQKQAELGRAGDRATANPKGQIALKFAHEMRETIVEAIDWQVGKSGRITPVVYVSPVSVAGVTIKKASLHNIANVMALGISPGASVLISRRNGVIPYLEEVLSPGSGVLEIPTLCPTCNFKLVKDGEYIQCPSDTCPSRVIGNVSKWIKNLEIEEFGPALIEAVYDAGWLKDVSDIYSFTALQLASLEGMGDKSAAKVLDNLHAKKMLSLHLFLGSLNIPGCGRRVFERIVKSGLTSLNAVLGATVGQLERIDGIGFILAKDITDGLQKRTGLIKALMGHIQIEDTKLATGLLTGKSFCFTGSLTEPRPFYEKLVVVAGGEIKGSVAKGLDYLVIADPHSDSTKAQKARKLGVSLVGEKELMQMLS